jgi:hypothetical protein
MTIRELHATFGILENKKLTLGDGLNIITVPMNRENQLGVPYSCNAIWY